LASTVFEGAVALLISLSGHVAGNGPPLTPRPTPADVTVVLGPGDSHDFAPPSGMPGAMGVINRSSLPATVTAGGLLTIVGQPGYVVDMLVGYARCLVPDDRPEAAVCKTNGGDYFMVGFTQLLASDLLPVSDAVTYPAGWNLVPGPAGYVPAGASAVYGLSHDLTAPPHLIPLEQPDPLKDYGNAAEWAYFPVATTVALPHGALLEAGVSLPAGQCTLFGNPLTRPAQVLGTEAVYVYDPVAQAYTQTTRLAVGQGAWVCSTDKDFVYLTAARAAQ
jgi:hypothetical protein